LTSNVLSCMIPVMSKASVPVSKDILKTLKAVKEQFRTVAMGKVTWDNFLMQLCLAGEIIYGTRTIKAVRVGMWIYEAFCPFCNQASAPLHRKGNVVWGVDCTKCGKRFIAVI